MPQLDSVRLSKRNPEILELFFSAPVRMGALYPERLPHRHAFYVWAENYGFTIRDRGLEDILIQSIEGNGHSILKLRCNRIFTALSEIKVQYQPHEPAYLTGLDSSQALASFGPVAVQNPRRISGRLYKVGKGQALETIEEVNRLKLKRGDYVAFAGGERFQVREALQVRSDVTYTRFGSGRPGLWAANRSGPLIEVFGEAELAPVERARILDLTLIQRTALRVAMNPARDHNFRHHGIELRHAVDVSISGCHITRCTNGIYARQSGLGLYVLGNHIHHCYNSSLYLEGHERFTPIEQSYIGWNHLHDVTQNDVVSLHPRKHSIGDLGPGHIIEGNYIYHGVEENLDLTAGSQILVRNNVLFNASGGLVVCGWLNRGTTLQQNLCWADSGYTPGTLIRSWVPRTYLYQNILMGALPPKNHSLVMLYTSQGADGFRSAAGQARLWHNLLYARFGGATGPRIGPNCLKISGIAADTARNPLGDIDLRRNIFLQEGMGSSIDLSTPRTFGMDDPRFVWAENAFAQLPQASLLARGKNQLTLPMLKRLGADPGYLLDYAQWQADGIMPPDAWRAACTQQIPLTAGAPLLPRDFDEQARKNSWRPGPW